MPVKMGAGNKKMGEEVDIYPYNNQLIEYLHVIEMRFSAHPPGGTQSIRYNRIRQEAHKFATELLRMCPESNELQKALDRLEEVMMWANKSIAVNER